MVFGVLMVCGKLLGWIMCNNNSAVLDMFQHESDRNILVDYRRAMIGYPLKGELPTIEQEIQQARRWGAGGRMSFSNRTINQYTVNMPASKHP